MTKNVNRIELPMPEWAKKHGYINWHKADDSIIHLFFGKAARVNLLIGDQRLKKRVIERKYRRIGIKYSITRALPKKISKVILTKSTNDIINVNFE